MLLPIFRTQSFLLATLFFLPLVFPTIGAEPPVILGLERELSPILEGKLLTSELSCSACHAGGEPSKGGPRLSDIGNRIQHSFLADFIANPQKVKPGTTMPQTLANLPEKEQKKIAQEIASYLIKGATEPAFTPTEQEASERGETLFKTVGCAACHSPYGEGLSDSMPLGDLSKKYRVKGLTDFLKNPLTNRPSGRMPNLALTHWEAQDIAHYLLQDQIAPQATRQPSAAESPQGERYFREYGCAQCHTPESARQDFAKSFALLDLTKSCTNVNYHLSPEQETSILAYQKNQEPLVPSDQIHFKMAQLNCYACHERNGIGGVTPQRDEYYTTSNLNLGDQARIPPSLTGVGAKLKPAAIQKILSGRGSVRPYMTTRMPQFGSANLGKLANWLTESDPLPTLEIADTPPKEASKIGHQLVGQDGFSCNACHTFLQEKTTTLNAIDLGVMGERLQKNWFHAYMKNPQIFNETTIMPSFWPNGVSSRPELLDGNTEQQLEALWAYLLKGPEARRPKGVRPEPIPYNPIDGEAIIFRRRYPGVGKRGIGVGYPSGLNLIFDASKMSLSTIWNGKFAEMSPVWHGQGSGEVRLAGEKIVKLPAGPAFALLSTKDEAWPTVDETKMAPGFQFLGYRLDDKQRPTFNYTFANLTITDYLVDHEKGPHFTRTLTFEGTLPAGLFFRAAAGAELTPDLKTEKAWKISPDLILSSTDSTAEIITIGDQKELRFPITSNRLTLSYRYLTK